MSRKIIWTALLLLAVGGLFLVYLWWRGTSTLAQQEALVVAAEESFANDEDGDGLAGWEEDLWRTNRHNPDSDGDGTSDGEEVRLGRDPRRAGNDDTLSEPQDKAIVAAAQVLVEKQAPLARLQPATVAKSSYTIVDLKLVPGESAATLKQYRESMSQLLTDYMQGLTANEQDAMYDAMEEGNTAALAILQSSRQNLQSALSKALLLPVPVSASLLHLNVVNSLASLGQIIYNMSQVQSEPLLAVESAELRNQKYLNVISAISAINRYLSKIATP